MKKLLLVLIICCVFCGCGRENDYSLLQKKYKTMTENMEYYKEKCEDLEEDNDSLNKELEEVSKNYRELKNSDVYKSYEDVEFAKSELAAIQKEIEQVEIDRDSKKTEIENEIKNLEADRDSKKAEIESEISELEKQQTSIKEKIDANKSKPISFYAGEYICGQDFPEGRYLIYDGSSNFFVSGGKTYVNIVLGNPSDYPGFESLYTKEYVHFFTKGEMIESRSAFKLKLIE